jgi:bifunctional UDP-N-acetylglucosamine pyrophosphorylase/glucosamine-1-phosphate N-acetyltransferase
MRSARHKMLHLLAGRPLLRHALDLVHSVGASSIVVVLGHQAEQVRQSLPDGVEAVIQEPQLGTGHALQVAADRLRRTGAERVLVHLGDVPLVRPRSLQRLTASDLGPESPVALLTARVADPRGYGRVIRGSDSNVERMVEEVDATPEQRRVDEVWSGSMLFWTPWLWQNLADLPRSPKGEYYLPELVNRATAAGLRVHAVQVEDETEVLGVNDRRQLAAAESVARRRTLDELMLSGVTVVDPNSTYIEPDVTIEPDVVIQPGCHLRGSTRVARGCEIGPNTLLLDTQIGPDSRIWFSVLEGAMVGARVNVGPFSHLRPGAVIEDDVELGNYAEVKGSRVGAGSQMHHFSYIGDAEVGQRVNVGAGTITVNFSSETRLKSRTVVEDDASLGSDTLLVAPVQVGERAMTGAGAVVTRDIPAGEVWLGAPARPHRRRRDRSANDEKQT